MTITVITTTFNSAKTVRDTIESVLSQSWSDIEYIIIDGASTDNTVSIIKEYEPRFNGRMKWISEKDHGIYDAMNKGIQLATGDVIGFLNSDDFYTSSDVLSTVAENIPGVDAVYGDVHYVSPNNLSKCVRYYSSKKFSKNKMKYGFLPAHPSFYCKREIYSRYGGFDIKFRSAADFDCLYRLLYLNNITTKYIPKDFVTMQTGGETSSGLKSYRKTYNDRKNIFKKYGKKYSIANASVLYFSRIIELIKSRLLH